MPDLLGLIGMVLTLVPIVAILAFATFVIAGLLTDRDADRR